MILLDKRVSNIFVPKCLYTHINTYIHPLFSSYLHIFIYLINFRKYTYSYFFDIIFIFIFIYVLWICMQIVLWTCPKTMFTYIHWSAYWCDIWTREIAKRFRSDKFWLWSADMFDYLHGPWGCFFSHNDQHAAHVRRNRSIGRQTLFKLWQWHR